MEPHEALNTRQPAIIDKAEDGSRPCDARLGAPFIGQQLGGRIADLVYQG